MAEIGKIPIVLYIDLCQCMTRSAMIVLYATGFQVVEFPLKKDYSFDIFQKVLFCVVLYSEVNLLFRTFCHIYLYNKSSIFISFFFFFFF